MIALRGRLTRDKGSAVAAAASGTEESSSPAADVWKWQGVWAFGAQLDAENEPKALPFEYVWHATVDPATIAVPSSLPKDDGPEIGNEADPTDINVDTPKSLSGDGGVGPGTRPEDDIDDKDKSPSKEEDDAANRDKDQTQSEVKDVSKTEDPSTSEEATKRTDVVDNAAKPVTSETFAESPFADAAELYPNACPQSGEWKGHFSTLSGRKGAPHVPIRECFYLFVNGTPPDDARVRFFDDDDPNDAESAKLPDDHLHVRGTGTNQYGVFELVGSLDLASGLVACQRMYVRTNVAITPRSSNKRGRARGSAASVTAADGASGSRPYFTRKKQMSWKRRAEQDMEQGMTPGADSDANRRKSEPLPRIRQKKQKAGDGPAGQIGPRVLTVQIPPFAGSTSIGAAPGSMSQLSPAVSAASGTSSKRSKQAPSSAPNRSTSMTPSSTLKLPAAGDPEKARWRAAHFLYYQRFDPPAENASNTAAGAPTSISNGGTAAAGAAAPVPPATPKYVVYEGEMWNGQRDGRGVCLFSNGLLYEGEWKENKEHGRGMLLSADRKRTIYVGEFERGRMHGKGIYFYYTRGSKQAVAAATTPIESAAVRRKVVQSRYEGEFRENLRHGDGTYVLPDGSLYVGQFQNGHMCGRGVFTWPDGSHYDGDWKNGKRHGLGILKCSDGFRYDGAWVRNAMEGRGSAVYPNGQEYHGLFSNGRREGRGTLRFTNGAVYEGRFRDDAVDGQGTMKMTRSMLVPREDTEDDGDGDGESNLTVVASEKPDFMIPISFQSDMGHIHRKAGFTMGGE